MSVKILITGGAGYIGSCLSRSLVSNGYTVTVVDNLFYKQQVMLDLFQNKKFNFLNFDIRNENLLYQCLKNSDIIIPLAALVGAPACKKNPEYASEVNYKQLSFITKNISNNQKLILPTTNSGYGVGSEDKFCDEKSPINPLSHYAITKMEAEKLVIDNGNGISLRLATVFGPSERFRLDLLVNDFVYRAYKDGYLILFEGHFKRNFIHICDVVSAFIHMIDNYEELNNNIFNVGLSEANLSKIELCNQIKKHLKDFYFIESEFKEDPDKRDYIVSNNKIEKSGWYPRFSLDDGISSLINMYKILKVGNFSNND